MFREFTVIILLISLIPWSLVSGLTNSQEAELTSLRSKLQNLKDKLAFINNHADDIKQRLINGWKSKEEELENQQKNILDDLNKKYFDRKGKEGKAEYLKNYIAVVGAKTKETSERNSQTLARKKEELESLVSTAIHMKAELVTEEQREANMKKLNYNIKSQTDLKVFDIETLYNELFLLTKQTQLQQLAVMEKARSNGVSGIKQIKTQNVGGKNYHTADHKDWEFAGIKDYPEHQNKLGVGAFSAVLNGVEFRSNVDSYSMRQPSLDGVFDGMKTIKYPPVPKDVIIAANVKEQIEKMKQWFIGFQDGDQSRYFKPVISYLEGVWLNQDFDHDEADKMQFISETASPLDHGYRPITIMGYARNESGIHHPIFGSWTHKLIAYPVTKKLTPAMFKLRPDIVSLIRHYNDVPTLLNSPAADFDIEHLNSQAEKTNKPQQFSYLDLLMSAIPGKDNTLSTENNNNNNILNADPHPESNGKPLDTSHYHRAYLTKIDSGSSSNAQRTFSDHLYVAETTKEQIAGPSSAEGKKVSYAVPFEVVFLTPLGRWNPYNINIKKRCNEVTGSGTKEDPYDSACPDRYFLTPQEFYTGETETCGEIIKGEHAYFFKSPDQVEPVCLVASGIRTILPKVQGTSTRVRTRFPIMHAYKDGTGAAKKLNAIEDSLSIQLSNLVSKVSLLTGVSTKTNLYADLHRHHLRLTLDQFRKLQAGNVIQTTTAEDNTGHQHTFKIQKSKSDFIIIGCDTESGETGKFCKDAHCSDLQIVGEPLKPGHSGYGYGYGYSTGYGYGYGQAS